MTLYEYAKAAMTDVGAPLNTIFLQTEDPLDPSWVPPIYGSDDWFTWCKGFINEYIYHEYPDRELFNRIEDAGGSIAKLLRVREATHWLCVRNQYKYKHLYDLFLADYEPLWNVDGTTKTTYDWDMNRTGKDELTRSGEDKNVRSGNQANAVTGTDTTTNSTTTYDSSSDHTTDKSALLHGRTDTLTFNSVTDTRTYTNLKDSREYTNLKDKKSGTETVERSGNIGITKATELAADALDWAGKFKLPEIIACDIVGAISYPFV